LEVSVAAYVKELGELLSGSRVTGSNGEAMTLDEGISSSAGLILEARADGSKVMVMGNGGSAAIASHLHNDLCKAVGVRSLVFNEPPLLTALANDHGYGCVFEHPVSMWAEKDDILVAISSSGRSENILRATKAAMDRGCRVITFSGFAPDNPLCLMGTMNFYVRSDSYGFVEVAHSALTHFLSDTAAVMGGQ